MRKQRLKSALLRETIAGALLAIGHSIQHDTCSPARDCQRAKVGGGGAGLTAQACSSLAEAWEPCWAMRDSRLSYW